MSVLVAAMDTRDIELALRVGARIARAREVDLNIVCPRTGRGEPTRTAVPVTAKSEHLATDVSARRCFDLLAENERFGLAAPNGEQGDEPDTAAAEPSGQRDAEDVAARVPPCVRLWLRKDASPYAAILGEVRDTGAGLLVVIKRKKGASGPLYEQLEENVPCELLILRPPADDGTEFRHIMVPTASGHNVPTALRIGQDLTRADGGQITSVYVEPAGGEDAEAVGLRQIKRNLDRAGVGFDDVEHRVVIADSIRAGIARATETGDYDLILIGASDRSAVRRLMFGTVPAAILRRSAHLAVGVVRQALPVTTRTRRLLDNWLSAVVPQLDRDQRIALFETLQVGSNWDIDFVTLICLSTSIASMGLVLNSTAVVIGAMLVAPLMTPMLGVGLGLVQGNLRLVRNALKCIGLGFTAALGLGAVIGLISPIEALTPELLGRGAPNLLDLGVALLSGVAAAYACARPGLSSALPGVAIAAALVPPIGTTGISLVLGEFANAQGAATLFGVNFLAIVLGAAITLYTVGARPDRRLAMSRVWVRRTALAFVLGILLIALPLGAGLFSYLQNRDPLRDAIAERLEREPNTTFESMAIRPDSAGRLLEVVMTAPDRAPDKLARKIAYLAADHLDGPVRVRIVTRLATPIAIAD